MASTGVRIRTAALLLAAALTFSASAGASGTADPPAPEPGNEEVSDTAVPEDMPSLFRNDLPWYKDTLEPLIMRNGVPYVPADFLGMFPGVSFTMPADNNLLLASADGTSYVSILLDDGTSVVNGEIGDTVGLFRDGTVLYVEAEPVCLALGLGEELSDGPTLRITDGNERLTMEQLIGSYLPREDAAVKTRFDEEPEPARRLFIFCTSPEDAGEYSIERELERYGMNCTVFLWHDASPEEILAGQSYGAYGVATTDEEDTAGALAEADERIREMTRRRTRWTLTTEDPETDGKLRAAGFCPLTPDFTVTSLTALDTMMAELEGRLNERNEVYVFLTDCWKGTVAVSLLRALLDNHSDWADSNLGG